MAEPSSSSSGVKKLISRIRDEGVQAGQQEADRILNDAKTQAAIIISEANADAAATREKARRTRQARRRQAGREARGQGTRRWRQGRSSLARLRGRSRRSPVARSRQW